MRKTPRVWGHVLQVRGCTGLASGAGVTPFPQRCRMTQRQQKQGPRSRPGGREPVTAGVVGTLTEPCLALEAAPLAPRSSRTAQ